METRIEMTVKDIPLSRLVVSNEKRITNFHLDPIRRSMEEIGMLEPLLVYEKDDTALIIDGNKRYRILVEAGIESVPCVLVLCPDTYTASRQVINVSPVERAKMIRKALETVAESRVAAAIGVASLKPVLDDKLSDGLSEAVKIAFKQGMFIKVALQELKHVTPNRQDEILKELTQKGGKQNDSKRVKPYSLDIIKALVLSTPETERVDQKKKKTPWTIREEKVESITKEWRELKERGGLMACQFHTYVGDLVKMLNYTRGFLKDDTAKQYVRTNHPEVFKKVREIMSRE